MSKKKKTTCSSDVRFLLELIEYLGFYAEDIIDKGFVPIMTFTGSHKNDLNSARKLRDIKNKYGKQ